MTPFGLDLDSRLDSPIESMYGCLETVYPMRRFRARF